MFRQILLSSSVDWCTKRWKQKRNATELWPQNASKGHCTPISVWHSKFQFFMFQSNRTEGNISLLEKLYRLSNSKIFTMWAVLTVKAQNFLELRNIVFRSAGFQRYLSTLVNFHNISTNWWRKEITSAVLRSQGLLPFRFRYYFCLGSFQYVANSLFELIVILIKKKKFLMPLKVSWKAVFIFSIHAPSFHCYICLVLNVAKFAYTWTMEQLFDIKTYLGMFYFTNCT